MARHLTARLAWHDSAWNGHICSHPSGNFYCIGGRSLLSDRLRRDRDASLEDSAHGKPLDARFPNYVPPCFWGINAFGTEPHNIVHRHPFADLKETHAIDDSLPAFSVLTWPFRLSFNHDQETEKRYGKYHPKLEDRINQFFAAHREQQSLVFLYLNYDNPVSSEEQRYAVVGCGLLKEKGSPTRFKFTPAERQQHRSGHGMQNFPEVNWARRLTLDPTTVVRLPYQEYARYVRAHPQEDSKLDDIAVLVTDEALIPSFKYVCDSMDDDQCLYVLYQLRKAAERIGGHGIVTGYEQEAVERLDLLIAHVWKQRGAYPGLSSALAYLAKIGEQSDDAKEQRAQQLVDALRAEVGNSLDLTDEAEKLLKGSDPLPRSIAEFSSFLRHIRSAISEDPALLPQLMQLSQFCLSAFQMERILAAGASRSDRGPFGHASASSMSVIKNPYVLAESYVPITSDRALKWKEFEHPLRRDGPIGVFHIDAGLFPNEEYVIRGSRYDLSPAGPERVRALVLQHLTEQASRHSDSFSPLEKVYEGILENPLFYRRNVTLRQDVLTSGNFLEHFRDRIAHVEYNARSYFYLREIREAEQLVERTIQELVNRPARSVDLSWIPAWIKAESETLKEHIREFNAEAFQEERSQAIAALLGSSFCVLTGKPGSGKTHVLGKVVQTLLAAKHSVTVLAPTGKAVLRLTEEAGMPARTIDKLLHDAWLTEGGVAGPEDVSSENLKHIGDIRNLVIDESSMLDLPKLATLFRILHRQGLDKTDRVILVGDVNQLPPIGLGRPFEDVVFWLDREPKRHKYHVHLDTNCRQQRSEKVLELAEMFVGRNRYYNELLEEVQQGTVQDENLKVFLWKSTDDMVNLLDNELSALIGRELHIPVAQKEQGLNVLLGLQRDGSVPKEHLKALTLERFQIVTPYHGRFAHAARELNEAVHSRYKMSALAAGGFSHGDKIIRLSNKYDGSELLVSNGTLGVVAIDGANRKPRVFFNSRPNPLKVGGEEHEQYDLAYAITVHKAQGSEFDHVFVVLSSHWPLLTRELVYTALTRSKQTVTLFLEAGDKRPLELALRRSAVLGRNSSVFEHPLDKNMLLEPEPGEHVDSKIEYILYSALKRARDAGRLRFKHHESLTLHTPGGPKLVKPDFVIEAASGKWILEHLGMLDGKRYATRWEQKRAQYSAAGFDQLLVTTDDLNGVLDCNIERVINDICSGTPVDTPKNRFSNHHYRLGDLS